MVNFFTVTGGKLIECQKQEIGKLIGCQCGKQIQCQVVNFFIDIHNVSVFLKILFRTDSVKQVAMFVIFHTFSQNPLFYPRIKQEIPQTEV